MRKFNVCGIICEYNPFHNGHMYQLEEARMRSSADYVIAVMSGNFVQRGEPAAFDKWTRAEMALSCGADMVVELPTVYALSSAEYFATGAVDLLNKMGIVTHISFGSETFDAEEGAAELEKFAVKTKEGPQVDKNSLKNGDSFAVAARNEQITLSNDVLGVEYVRALKRIGSHMQVIPVKRTGNGHDLPGSAMYIRSLLGDYSANIDEIKLLLPEPSVRLIEREFNAGRGHVKAESFDKIVLADLRRLGTEGLKRCPFVSEGLEYKIYSAACECTDFAGIIKECTSRRYTASRIRRIIFALMLGITRNMINMPAPYIRVLGMRRNCGPLMDTLTENARLPVITSKAKFIKSCEVSADVISFLKIDSNAADLYSIGFPSESQRLGDSEMTHPLVYMC